MFHDPQVAIINHRLSGMYRNAKSTLRTLQREEEINLPRVLSYINEFANRAANSVQSLQAMHDGNPPTTLLQQQQNDHDLSQFKAARFRDHIDLIQHGAHLLALHYPNTDKAYFVYHIVRNTAIQPSFEPAPRSGFEA